jgi:hypothetical protein
VDYPYFTLYHLDMLQTDRTDRNPRAERLTVEQALSLLGDLIDQVENSFVTEHGRLIDLTSVSDWLLLPEHFDPCGIVKQHPQLSPYALGHRMLRNFLERQVPFDSLVPEDKMLVFDSLVGRLNYLIPSREYTYLIEATEQVKDRGLIDLTRDEVSKLAAIISLVPERFHSASSEHRRVLPVLGDSFINPAGTIKRYLMETGLDKVDKPANLEVLIDTYKRLRDAIQSGDYVSRYI